MESEFSNSKLKNWLIILCVWVFAAIVFSTFTFLQESITSQPSPYWRYLSWQTSSCLTWFLLTPLVIQIVSRFPLERQHLGRNFLIYLVSGLLLIVIHTVSDALVLPNLGFHPQMKLESFTKAFRFFLVWYFVWNLLIYIAVLGVTFGINYYRKFSERELRTTQLEATLAKTRLQALKNQIHPHFLFNTHNSIIELIHSDAETAEKMLTNLSDLLRLALENTDIEEVTLKQELEFSNKYLEIEQIRFEERLKVKLEIDPNTLDTIVPNMILQPLIENALKHGIAPLLEGGTIKVSSEQKDGILHLSVADDGVGIAADEISRINYGIGLSNTQERLKFLYNGNHNFEIKQNGEKGLLVKLSFPFQRSDYAAEKTEVFFD